MSTHSISIVPKLSSFPNNTDKAIEILNWLVSKDIVENTSTDCTYGSEYGYAISEGAKRVISLPDDLPYHIIPNGLDIVTERRVFDTGQNGMNECICPHCKENIALEEWDFISKWYENESNNITCTKCGKESEIHLYSFEPEWGFSNLGFTFWNLVDFTDEFLAEFKQKLGCDLSIVYQHL